MKITSAHVSRILFIVAVFVFVAHSAIAASFPCEKASTQVEKLICGDPELSKLDEELDTAYQRALGMVAAKKPLHLQQRDWLATRDACADNPCIRRAYDARLSRLTHDNRYELEKGRGVEVCEAYEKSLNSFWPRLPMVCGRPASSELGFDKPKWEQTHDPAIAEAFWDYSKFLWERDVNPIRYFRSDHWPQWKDTPTQRQQAYRSFENNRERLWVERPPVRADIDIDNDGKTDHVYFEQPCGSVYGDLFGVLNADRKTIDRKKTDRLLPHPPFRKMGAGVFRPVKKGDWGIPPIDVTAGYSPVEDAVGYVHYDFFFFKKKTYIDQWWVNHPDFMGQSDTKAGRLRVFEVTPADTKELCTYRFRFEG